MRLFIGAALALAGCQEQTDPGRQQKTAAANSPSPQGTPATEQGGGKDGRRAAKAQNGTIPAPDNVAAAPKDAERTESGLAYKVLTPPQSETKPGPKDLVRVHYTGWTTDGTMFDSSVARGRPSTFPVNRVIAGWTEGLQLMGVGQKMRLWIPAEMAYGNKPRRPGAPSGMLVFDVELLDIIRPPESLKSPAAAAKRTQSGLAYQILEQGAGQKHPKPTDRVKVHYTGWTTQGDMFDSSLTRGRPAVFPLTNVIDGWTEGLQHMVEGDRALLWIPADLAYGEDPKRPGAPAGDLVFEIQLLEIL